MCGDFLKPADPAPRCRDCVAVAEGLEPPDRAAREAARGQRS